MHVRKFPSRAIGPCRRLIKILAPLFLIGPVLGISHLPEQPLGPGITRDEAAARPAKGMLLIARRHLPDPNFHQSVVLLLRHDGHKGSLGLIINQPTSYTLNDILPELKGLDRSGPKLYFGGPVELEGLMFLFRAREAPDAAWHITRDIYLGGDIPLLEHALSGEDDARRTRVFIGHAGWAPGQLEAEIGRGDWHLYPADPHTLLEQNPRSLWPELIELKEPSGRLAETAR